MSEINQLEILTNLPNNIDISKNEIIYLDVPKAISLARQHKLFLNSINIWMTSLAETPNSIQSYDTYCVNLEISSKDYTFKTKDSRQLWRYLKLLTRINEPNPYYWKGIKTNIYIPSESGMFTKYLSQYDYHQLVTKSIQTYDNKSTLLFIKNNHLETYHFEFPKTLMTLAQCHLKQQKE